MSLLALSLLVLVTVGGSKGQANPACFDKGECKQSQYVGATVSPAIQGCLDNCKSNPDCNFFTYFETDGICDGFNDCVVFDQTSCQDCYSGSTDCPDVQCEVQGQCYGTFVNSLFLESYSSCLEACQSEETCQWLTYDPIVSVCTLLMDCDDINTSCDGCVSSQRFCTADGGSSNLLGDLTKVLAIGGYQERYLNQVEVFDLLNPGAQCNFLADLPIEVREHTAALVNGVLKTCGGEIDINEDLRSDTIEVCFDYDPTTNTWTEGESLLAPRQDAGSSVVNGDWLISGGRYTYVNETSEFTVNYADTEIFSGTSFSQGVGLPYEMGSRPCQVTLDSSRVFLLDDREDRAFILDYLSGETTLVPYPNRGHVNDAACGLIRNSVNGDEVVVTGQSYTDIFNLATMTWRHGPDLFPAAEDMGYAQLENTFVVAGGDFDDVAYDGVYLFDNEKYEWILLGELQIARILFQLVAVPGDYVNCQ